MVLSRCSNEFHDLARPIDSSLVRYGMSRFNDFDSVKRQPMTVLDDNHATLNSVAQKLFGGKGHSSSGLAAPNDKNISNVRKLITPVGYLEVVIATTNIFLDRIERVRGFHARHEYLPCVDA